MWESLFNKVAGLLQHIRFLVNIAKFFDSNVRRFSAKKGRFCHSTRCLNTLLVGTISTRFY